ncbi:MAG TPA: aminoglycoside phosphotransferase family protein [Verrucomicrobiae bacterium]|nr:aminoglycoside phosphotransferase family protein [Verrucomicrobiae bacterium]
MLPRISQQDIEGLLNIAGITGFAGRYAPLGSGEGNDTFVLDCEETRLVLRVARYSEISNLANEALALGLLALGQVPRLVYYNESQRINGKAWIIESHIAGTPVDRLDIIQLENLGELLAKVHSVHPENTVELGFWTEFLKANKRFGDEQAFLAHPDKTLRKLINRARDYFQLQKLYTVQPSLVHGDMSLGNMLVRGSTVSLIDWEFARFTDPMADFSAMFYEDMAYNKGRWRIHITPQEKSALFTGYNKAGGVMDEQRLKAWHIVDKLGGAVYLYWKLNHSGHVITQAQSKQYKEDLDKLFASLGRNI